MVGDSTHKLDVGDKLSGFKSQAVLFCFACFVFFTGCVGVLESPSRAHFLHLYDDTLRMCNETT